MDACTCMTCEIGLKQKGSVVKTQALLNFLKTALPNIIALYGTRYLASFMGKMSVLKPASVSTSLIFWAILLGCTIFCFEGH